MIAEMHGHEKSGGIYAIRNRADGRVYIGVAARFGTRMVRGVHANQAMQRDHGRGVVLDFEVIAVIADEPTRLAVEREAIARLRGTSCYNVRFGDQPSQLGKHWTLGPEARANIARAATGRRHTAETRAKMSAAKRGKRPAESTIAASVAARTGRALSVEHRSKIGASHVGKKHPNRAAHGPLSEEHRAKLRIALLGNTNGKKKES